MANKIGIVIAADGEQKFSAAMRNCASAAKNLQSDLKTLKNDFKDSANSMEYLTQRQNMLKAAQESYKRSLEAAKSGLSHQKSVYKEQQKSLEELRKKLSDAKKAVSDFEKAGDTSSKGYKDATKAVEDYSKAIDKQSVEIQKSEGKLNQWEHAVNSAQHDLNSANSAIDQNAKYLNEAAQSADGCATSIDRFGKEMREAGEDSQASGGKIGSMMDKIKTGALLKVGALATQAVQQLGRKAVEAAKYVIDVGSTFEASMSKVEALSGASGSELDALKEKASELGRTTQFSASEAADALSNMALAGWSTQEMLTGIDGVLQLAAAGGMDLATAADSVAGYLAAFNMEASESSKLADVMATAQAKSKTTTDQLSQAYSTCATNLTQAGQEMTTTTALLEGMASVNDTGSAAGTKLSAVMSQITQKMKDGKIAIGDAKVAVTDSSGAFRDMVDIIADVEKATDGMTDAQRAQALGQTFNRQSTAGMNELLSVGSEKLREYKQELENSEGAAANMAATMQDNLQGKVKELNSATEGLGNALYEKVSGPLTEAVQIATGLINGITDAISPQKTELENFLTDIVASNEQVQALLDAADQDIAKADAKVTQLETYKNTIVELQAVLQNGGKLDTFQLYQMKEAVSNVKDEVPHIGENFDAVTGRIGMSTEAIMTLFEKTEEGIQKTARELALQKEAEAYEQAMVNQASATAALTIAQKELSEAMSITDEEAAKLDYDLGSELQRLRGNVSTAQKALDDATKNAEHAAKVQEELKKELKNLDEQQRQTAESTDELTRRELVELQQQELRKKKTEEATQATKQAADANGEFADSEDEAGKAAEEAAQTIQSAHDSAAESIKEAYESAKQSIESSFQIDPTKQIDTEDKGQTVEQLTRNLQSQIEAWQNYQQNLEIIKEHVGKEIAPEFMQYLIGMGEDGANTLQHIVDTFAGKVEDGTKTGSEVVKELSDAVVDSLDIKEEITTELAGDSVALQAGLKEFGSGATEWQGLTDIVSGKIHGLGDSIGEPLKQEFVTASNTAKTLGVSIPEGLAEGIENSDDPEAAIRNAIDQINAAIEGQGDGLLGVAKECGVKVPQSIKDGIDAGGDEAVQAYKDLLQLLADTNTEIEQTGKETGQKYVEGQVAGTEEAAGQIAEAAENAASEAADAAGEKQSEFHDEGQEATAQYGQGITDSQDSAVSAASSMAQAALSGARQWEGSWYSLGVNLAQGVANGIQSQIQAVAAQAAALVRNAMNAAKAEGGVHSPSRKWRDQIGKMLGKGTALGIKQSTHEVVSAAEYQLGRTLLAAQKWINKNKKKISDLGTALSSTADYTPWMRLGEYEAGKNFGVKKTKTTGSGNNKKTVKKDVETYYGEIFNAAKDYMEKVKVLFNVSDKQELAYWNKVAKRLKRGTSAWFDARQKIKDLQEDIEKQKYDTIVSDAEDYVEEQKDANAMSITNEIAYWNKILKQLKKGSEQYKSVASKITDLKKQIGTVDTADALLGNYQTYFDISEKATVEYWDKIRKQYKAGTEDRIAADKKYLDAKQAYTDKLKSIEDSYIQKIDEANQKYKDALEDRKDEILGAFDIFDTFESNSPLGKELLFNIEAQAAGYEEWSDSLDELRDRGIFSDELMEELTQKGPQEIAAIKALLMLTDDQLKAYQSAYDRREAAAAAQAEKDTSTLKKTIEDEITELKRAQAEEIAAVSTSLDSNLSRLASQIGIIASDMVSALVYAFKGDGSKAPESVGASVSASVKENAGLTSSGDPKNSQAESTSAKSATTPAPAASKSDKEQASLKDRIKAVIKQGDSHKKAVSDDEKKKHSDLWQYIVKKYGRAIHTKQVKELGKLLGIQVSDDPTDNQRTKILNAIKKKGLSGGSRSIYSNAVEWMDEAGLGSELIIRKSDRAILTRLKAHDAVVPANLTDNLFKWGAINPDALSVASGSEMNARMIAAQMQELDKANGDILDSLATIINYLPAIAAGLTIDGKRMSTALGEDMSQTLAAQYRRKR